MGKDAPAGKLAMPLWLTFRIVTKTASRRRQVGDARTYFWQSAVGAFLVRPQTFSFGKKQKESFSLRKKENVFLLFSCGEKSNKKAAGREPLWASIRVAHITS